MSHPGSQAGSSPKLSSTAWSISYTDMGCAWEGILSSGGNKDRAVLLSWRTQGKTHPDLGEGRAPRDRDKHGGGGEGGGLDELRSGEHVETA